MVCVQCTTWWFFENMCLLSLTVFLVSNFGFVAIDDDDDDDSVPYSEQPVDVGKRFFSLLF